MTVTAERETCRLHPDGCRDQDRHPLASKIRTDIRREMRARVASYPGETVNSLAEEAIEARLGLVRCVACHQAVPLIPGDLAGRPLDDWIRQAVEEVRGQSCRAHEPVPLGAARTAPRTARKPATRREHAAARTAPLSPGSAVFLEPGGSPVIGAAVPDRKKRQR